MLHCLRTCTLSFTRVLSSSRVHVRKFSLRRNHHRHRRFSCRLHVLSYDIYIQVHLDSPHIRSFGPHAICTLGARNCQVVTKQDVVKLLHLVHPLCLLRPFHLHPAATLQLTAATAQRTWITGRAPQPTVPREGGVRSARTPSQCGERGGAEVEWPRGLGG